MSASLVAAVIALLAGRPPAPPAGTPPPEPETVRWFSITQGGRHLGVMILRYSLREGGILEVGIDIRAPVEVIAGVAQEAVGAELAQVAAALEEERGAAPGGAGGGGPPGSPARVPPANYSFLAVLAEQAGGRGGPALVFQEGRESFELGGLTSELRVRRAENRWTLLFRRVDGSQPLLTVLSESPTYSLWDGMVAAARARRVVENAEFRLVTLGASSEMGFELQWAVRVDAKESAAAGGRESVEMFPVGARTRRPGRREESRVDLWVDAEGRVVKVRLPVEGGDPILFEWKANAAEASGGVEPLLRRGRGDPFDRSLARREPRLVEEDPQQFIARLEQDMAAAEAAGDLTALARLLGEAQDWLARVDPRTSRATREQIERVRHIAERLRERMGTTWAEVLRAQFEDKKQRLALAVQQGELGAAQRLLGEMEQIAGHRELSPEEQARMRAEIESMRDAYLVADLRRRILGVAGEDFFQGYAIDMVRRTEEPVRIDLSLFGTRVRWETRVPVHWPRAHIVIRNKVYAEGSVVDLGIGEPVEIHRVETDRVIFRLQGRLEVPIQYPVGRERFAEQAGGSRWR